LRGIIGALPQLLVGVGSGLLVMALGWWVTGSRGPLPLTGTWIHPTIMAVAMLVALLLTWFGTHSWVTRYGARVVLQKVAPGNVGIAIIVLALFVTGYLLFALLLNPAAAINWWPGVAPPLL